MATDEQNNQPAPWTDQQQPTQPDTATWPPPPTAFERPARPPFSIPFGVSTATCILLGLQVLIMAFSAIGEMAVAASRAPSMAMVSAIGLAGDADELLLLPTIVVFLIWYYRVYKNLDSFGIAGQMPAGWAIAYFFIPILQLYKPVSATQTIWKGSEPDATIEAAQWQRRRGTPLIVAWWVLNVGSDIVAIAGVYLELSGLSSVGSSNFRNGLGFVALANFMEILSALLLIRIIRAINARQLAVNDEITAREAGGG